MRNILPIARQTVIGPIEERRVYWIVCVFIPCPVGLIAIVATLVAEGLLECSSVVAVPC